MLIAIVDFDVAPSDRTAALDHLLAEVSAVSAMKGNRAYRPFADPLDDSRVTIVHEWESRIDFDAYLASPSFVRSGEVLRPMMSGAPNSRRFEARLIERVN